MSGAGLRFTSLAVARTTRRAGRRGARWSPVELEELGRLHARGSFDQSELHARLGGADWTDDRAFAACGLDEQAITRLRQGTQVWGDGIGERLQELEVPHED